MAGLIGGADLEIDWAELKRRVAAAGQAIAGATEPSAAAARAILEERARRLAIPPQSPEPGERIHLVTVSLANETYGLDAAAVLDVFRLSELAPLPGAEAPFFGLTAWRGDLLTLLDLRPALGLSAHALDDLSRVLVLGRAQAAFGVLVDAVRELCVLPARDVRPPPEDGRAIREYVRGITADAVLVLDTDYLLRSFG
jgi:purine-binding chemotaxis protein CheW